MHRVWDFGIDLLAVWSDREKPFIIGVSCDFLLLQLLSPENLSYLSGVVCGSGQEYTVSAYWR